MVSDPSLHAYVVLGKCAGLPAARRLHHYQLTASQRADLKESVLERVLVL